MVKKAYLIAAAVIIVLILSVPSLYLLQLPAEEPPAIANDDDVEGLPEGYEDTALSAEEIAASFESAKQDVSTILLGWNPYYAACVAVETGNKGACADIADESRRRQCEFSVRIYEYDKVVLEGDCSEMAGIGDPASSQDKITICEKLKSGSCSGISSSVYAKYCSNLLDKNVADCIDEDTTKDDCEIDIFTFHALKNNDPAECDGISDFYSRGFCKGVVTGCGPAFIDDWAYHKASRDLGYMALCARIKSPEIMDLCNKGWLNFTEAIKSWFRDDKRTVS